VLIASVGGTDHIEWILAGTAVGGVAVGLLVLVFADEGAHLTARMARCSMGFLVAIVWIMAIADEVVNVLQVRHFVVSFSIYVMTFFSPGIRLHFWSVRCHHRPYDIRSGKLARGSRSQHERSCTCATHPSLLYTLLTLFHSQPQVFAPIMGFSACFGGPMVNILLGVGISGSYIISQKGGEPYSLYFTPTLVSSSLGLLALLLVTLVVVPMNGYMLTRQWGVFLLFAYVMLMTLHLVVEMRY